MHHSKEHDTIVSDALQLSILKLKVSSEQMTNSSEHLKVKSEHLRTGPKSKLEDGVGWERKRKVTGYKRDSMICKRVDWCSVKLSGETLNSLEFFPRDSRLKAITDQGEKIVLHGFTNDDYLALMAADDMVAWCKKFKARKC